MQNEWAESSYRAHENGTRTIGQDDPLSDTRHASDSTAWR